MKQKLFTILTLLLCLCSTAWADGTPIASLSFSDPTALPSNYTYSSTNSPVIVSNVDNTTVVNVCDGGSSTAPTFSNDNSTAPTGGKRWMAFRPAVDCTVTFKVRAENNSRIMYILDKDHNSTSSCVSSFTLTTKNTWYDTWSVNLKGGTWYAIIGSGSKCYINSMTFTSYAITWNNGGRGTAPTSPTSAYNFTLPTMNATGGYVNTGWTADKAVTVSGSSVSAGTTIAVGTSVTLTAATTFTGVWEEASDVAPTVTAGTNGTDVRAGATVTLTATPTGYPAPTLQWFSCDSEGNNQSAIDGATSSTYQPSTATLGAGTFYFLVKASNSVQSNVESNVVSIKVYDAGVSGTVSNLVAVSDGYVFVADDITINGTSGPSANTLYDGSKVFISSAFSVSTSAGSNTFGGSSHLNSMRLKNSSDYIAFKVSAPCKVTFYGNSYSDRNFKVGTSANDDTYGTFSGDKTSQEFTIPSAGTVYITGPGSDRYLAGFVVNYSPALTVSPSTASAFTYVVGNGPSDAQTFTVTGNKLTSTITATLSNTDAYEMRTGENAFAAGPLTDLASGTAVQVRLKSGLALGDSYSGNLTFSSTGADDKAIALSGSVTNQKYSITEGTHTNGDVTIDKETAEEGDEVTLTATPDFKYVFGSWSVYKTGEPATTVTVTNNQFTMPAYAVTVDATFTADPKKQVLYLTSNGTVNDNDKLYAALAEDYTVTKAAFDATKTVTDFDLVVFHESIGGGNYNKNLVKAAIEADVPVLNTKSYFYGADQNANDRWKWGAPNAGTSVDGATINPAYGNIASHPIFEGVDISDAGFVTLFNAATAKAMQPVTALASGKEGYTLAITPNVAAVGGNGVAIHELSAAQRGLSSGSAKYLMVSIGNGNGCFEKLTANGQKLLKNAAAYLIDNTASWTPTTSVSGTITASGWNTFSSYATLDLSKINGGAAYVASATSGNSVTLTPVTDKIVAAGTGLMIKGTPNEAFTIDATSAAATFEGTNLLVGLPNGGEVAKANNTDTWNYVFGWTDPTDPGFYLVNATLPTLGAGKAYLQTSAALSTETPARLNLVFDGETTAINGIEEVAPVTKTRKVVKNGRLVIETANGEFTVSGARVK